MREQPNPYELLPRTWMKNQYAVARLRGHDALRDFYLWELCFSGRGTALSDSELSDSSVVEAAAAVCVADDLREDWPVADLLKSDVNLPSGSRSRKILADWLDRKDGRTIPGHELSRADWRLHDANESVNDMVRRGVSEAYTIRYVAARKGILESTLKNYRSGRRGSTRRMDNRRI